MTQSLRIAVDVGNSRIKFGAFALPISDRGLPTPTSTLALPAIGWDQSVLGAWISELPSAAHWWVASVNRPATTPLVEFLNHASKSQPRLIDHDNLPITIAVPRPDHVGVDRLAGALAANRLRHPSRPAIVIHAGTAITVNLLTADGIFRGGAILPGIGTSARALQAFTDMLPNVGVEILGEAPPVLGDSTPGAIRSGLFWGGVGAIRELTARLGESLAVPPEVFLTGGAAPSVADLLDPQVRYVEHLVLAGIALANEVPRKPA